MLEHAARSCPPAWGGGGGGGGRCSTAPCWEMSNTFGIQTPSEGFRVIKAQPVGFWVLGFGFRGLGVAAPC